MNSLPNKITQIPRPQSGPGQFATFADLISDALDFPPPEGFKPSTMRARARVDAALKKETPCIGAPDDPREYPGIIEFEDADWQTAKEAVAAASWRIRSPDLLQLFELFGIT